MIHFAIGGEEALSAERRAVRIERTADGYQLLLNDNPYFICGAGWVNGNLAALQQAGGNSIRTWGADDLGSVLDQAHKLGLTVTAGIWLGQVHQGFRYDDAAAVEKQRAMVREVVLKYKDHPALLFWGLGNEVELHVDPAAQRAIWQEINDLARMVKELDPNHPTLTAVAGISEAKIALLNECCPALDALGVNAYGSLPQAPQQLKDWKWERPYIVTEFGPLGYWEVDKTPWGAPRELTSSQKADVYLDGYLRGVAGSPDRCLGSYAFAWGHKQEGTGTWFGLLLPDGAQTAAVDSLTFAWTGRWPDNLAPGIRFIDTKADGREAPPGCEIDAWAAAYDLDNDPLTIHWQILEEDKPANAGKPPLAHPEAIIESRGQRVRFRTPETEGPYRLFVTVLDGQGHAATANVRFFVKAGAKLD
ncbi:MAG: hypothetical protein IAF94_16575 [Pirellulaceae bacterium]|nr:hypothetical protein [Pirellulaceae bacterium]